MQPPQPPHTDPEPSSAGQPAPSQHHPPAPGTIPGRSRRWRLALAVPSAGIGIVTVLFVALLAHPFGMPQPFGWFGAPPVPADWQTYRDPAGLFSVRMPPGWAVRFSTDSATFGDRTGSASETSEDVFISDPALNNGPPSLISGSPWVAIHADPINTDFERHWYCQGFAQPSGPPTFFFGVPAQSDSNGGWLLETAHAHFQIDAANGPSYEYPGPATPSTPTPLPPATVTADQILINAILGSFRPTDPHALNCP
jgi:hypothetical protein